MRFGLRSSGLFVALLAGCAWIGAWATRQLMSRSSSGEGAISANRAFESRVIIPSSATDVCFYVDGCWIEADFAITEKDFLSWCGHHGWTVARIAEHPKVFKPARTSPLARHRQIRTTKGYECQTSSGTVIFDLNRGRACIRHYDC